jgi:predicted MFS family arabinose efflux permease
VERLGPTFYRLWSANTVSSVGNGITLAALGLLAATTTSDPVAIAAVFAAYDIPTLLFGLAGATAIDRMERRRLLVAMDVGRFVIVLVAAFLLVAGVEGLVLAYVVSVCVGAGTLVFDTTTSAAVADLCPPALLARANSVLYAGEDAMRDLLGIPLGAVLFAVSTALPFFVDAGTFAYSALLVASLRIPRRRRTPPDGAEPVDDAGERVQLREGVAYLRRHAVLLRLVVLWCAQGILFGATFALLVFYALQGLHLDAAGYGLLGAAAGVGMLAGNLGASGLVGTRDRGYAPILVLITAVAGVGYLLVGIAPGTAIAVVGLLIWGVAIATGNVAVATLRQRMIPSELYGRVFTVATVLVRTAVVVGSFAGGLVALAGGPRAPWLVAAGIQAVLVVAVAVLLPDRDLTAAIGPASTPPADGG